MGDVLEANFERDGGDGLFPPPSLHALLSLYLISSEQHNGNQVRFIFLLSLLLVHVLLTRLETTKSCPYIF